MLETTIAPVSTKTAGLLLAAFRAGQTEALTWVDLPVGDLTVTVAADAMKAPLAGRAGVRLPVSYAEAVILCRELECVSPTQAIADAMFAKAASQLSYVGLVLTAADSAKMTSVDFALKFDDGVRKQLAAKPPAEPGLTFGAWKLWLLHARLAERGAVNYGFWDKSRKPPRPIQTVGGKHGPSHYDYSQLFQPVKRWARKTATGEPVDLLEHIARKDRVAPRFLDPYRQAPDPTEAPVFPSPEELEIDLAEILAGAGVDVAEVDGWKTRGKPGFAPVGVMVHHTAGPRKGDAPSLNLCIKGRLDPKNPKNNLSGPLCHIVLARSGKAHIIAARLANHAGSGAKQVLEQVRNDEPVTGNAFTRKLADAISGNPHFYGIEVENAGLGNDPYPDAQIQALGQICATLCLAHGWSANRVIHHRQWTRRKPDMSFRGDVPGLVAQLMDTSEIPFGVTFPELDEEPLPENTEPCLPWGEPEEEPAKKTAAKKTSKATSKKAAKKAAPKKAAPKKTAPKKAAPKKTAKKAAPKKTAKKAPGQRASRG